MQNIIDTIPGKLRIETYVKGNQVATSVAEVESFAFGKEKAPLALATHDEVPCFFVHDAGYFGAIKVSLGEAMDGKVESLVGEALRQNNLSGEGLHVIFGPCITFSHTPIESEVLAKAMEHYRGACKITHGVDYFDLPLAVLIAFRCLGVPMANIKVGVYDTFENPSLLYSATRGEEEENVTLATLL